MPVRQWLTVFLLVSVIPGTAHAYLDPATGSIILQALLGGLAVFLGILKIYWAKVRGFWQRMTGKHEKG